MPPTPTKLTPDAASLISTLDRRLRFITDERIPELRDCTESSLAVQQNLAEEVREEVGVFAREIENLSMMVDDQAGERARREVKGLVEKYTSELYELRAQTRTAILTSKKAIDAKQRASNRDQLFSTSSGQPPSKEASAPATLVEASTALTAALQRTVMSLQAELETSVFSNQLLTTSTKTLLAASNQHNSLTSAMDTSKHLLTALEKADWVDRLLLFGGFGFFILVVLFILKERFIDRGIRIMFWWWRFIPDFGGDEALLQKAEEAAVAASQSVSSVFSGVVSASVTTAMTTVLATLSSEFALHSSATSLDRLGTEPIPTVLSSILHSDSTKSPLPASTSRTHTLPVEHVEL